MLFSPPFWELRNIYHHHPERKKRKSSEANSGSIHPYGRYENAVKTRKTISTIAILWPVKAIFEKRAATVEVDTLISPAFQLSIKSCVFDRLKLIETDWDWLELTEADWSDWIWQKIDRNGLKVDENLSDGENCPCPQGLLLEGGLERDYLLRRHWLLTFLGNKRKRQLLRSLFPTKANHIIY